MALTITIAYYVKATIKAIKNFVVKAPKDSRTV
jgi:hypothetical protein